MSSSLRPGAGFTRLEFDALLTAVRQSQDPCDFALVATLGLLGSRIFGVGQCADQPQYRRDRCSRAGFGEQPGLI